MLGTGDPHDELLDIESIKYLRALGSKHLETNHVIELTGPDTASGLVYLLAFVTGDMMREGDDPLYWLGVYDEQYRRVDGGWRISKQSLNFVWPQRMLNDGFLDQYTPSS